MTKILIANWKEYPRIEAKAVALARASDFQGMVICPPRWFLDVLGSGKAGNFKLQHAALGGQDYEPGLPSLGVRYVIIGHSDRRRLGDTDVIVAEKMACAVRDGLTPILCVGETREQRARGKVEQVIMEQLRVGLSEIRNLKSEIWIAYEPVWAISVEPGAAPETASHAAARIAFLKERVLPFSNGKLKVEHWKFVYGGSITSANAHSFLAHTGIDGLLVGAASVQPIEIQKIWQLTQHTENNH